MSISTFENTSLLTQESPETEWRPSLEVLKKYAMDFPHIALECFFYSGELVRPLLDILNDLGMTITADRLFGSLAGQMDMPYDIYMNLEAKFKQLPPEVQQKITEAREAEQAILLEKRQRFIEQKIRNNPRIRQLSDTIYQAITYPHLFVTQHKKPQAAPYTASQGRAMVLAADFGGSEANLEVASRELETEEPGSGRHLKREVAGQAFGYTLMDNPLATKYETSTPAKEYLDILTQIMAEQYTSLLRDMLKKGHRYPTNLIRQYLQSAGKQFTEDAARAVAPQLRVVFNAQSRGFVIECLGHSQPISYISIRDTQSGYFGDHPLEGEEAAALCEIEIINELLDEFGRFWVTLKNVASRKTGQLLTAEELLAVPNVKDTLEEFLLEPEKVIHFIRTENTNGLPMSGMVLWQMIFYGAPLFEKLSRVNLHKQGEQEWQCQLRKWNTLLSKLDQFGIPVRTAMSEVIKSLGDAVRDQFTLHDFSDVRVDLTSLVGVVASQLQSLVNPNFIISGRPFRDFPALQAIGELSTYPNGFPSARFKPYTLPTRPEVRGLSVDSVLPLKIGKEEADVQGFTELRPVVRIHAPQYREILGARLVGVTAQNTSQIQLTEGVDYHLEQGGGYYRAVLSREGEQKIKDDDVVAVRVITELHPKKDIDGAPKKVEKIPIVNTEKLVEVANIWDEYGFAAVADALRKLSRKTLFKRKVTSKDAEKAILRASLYTFGGFFTAGLMKTFQLEEDSFLSNFTTALPEPLQGRLQGQCTMFAAALAGTEQYLFGGQSAEFHVSNMLVVNALLAPLGFVTAAAAHADVRGTVENSDGEQLRVRHDATPGISPLAIRMMVKQLKDMFFKPVVDIADVAHDPTQRVVAIAFQESTKVMNEPEKDGAWLVGRLDDLEKRYQGLILPRFGVKLTSHPSKLGALPEPVLLVGHIFRYCDEVVRENGADSLLNQPEFLARVSEMIGMAKTIWEMAPSFDPSMTEQEIAPKAVLRRALAPQLNGQAKKMAYYGAFAWDGQSFLELLTELEHLVKRD